MTERHVSIDALDRESSLGPNRTRQSLLVRLQSDPMDQVAWRELVELYGPKIYAWCRRWKLQEADGRDVTQVVLMKLAERVSTFRYDPSRSFRAYLKTLTYYSWVDFLKGRKDLALAHDDERGALLLASLEAQNDLLRRLEEAHEQHLLTEAMDRVSAKVETRTWEAFRLMAMEGRPATDVAARLGISVASAFQAKSRVQRMLQATVRELDPS